jgi:outer membrane receptor protein involved in Fe transport
MNPGKIYSLVAATFGMAAFGLASTETHAQGAASAVTLEEVVVTARRREESLQDVPISISVLNQDLIQQEGILDQYDLYELTPGITYEQSQDRQGARASVRGVGTDAQNPVRAKVTSFIDGVPVLGQTGALQFAGVERIEVMRGPQSAAFGRSTFSGAINYVTRDPGDELESRFFMSTSDLDRNIIGVALSGPITDTLGFTFDVSLDEFTGPDEWTSTEGLELGSLSTDYITGKLVWAPSDRFDMEVRVMSLETDDGPPLQYYIPEAALNACTNLTLPNGESYVQGQWNCNPSPPNGGIPQNVRPEETLTPGTTNHAIAQSFSVLEPGSFVDRQRIQSEFNFSFENDSAVQILASYSEDELRRWFDADASAAIPTFPMGMIMGVNSMANPNNIEETYLEARWVSPSDQPVRWLVGASLFDYDFLTNIWTQLAGVQLGLEDEANNGNPFVPIAINADASTNIGIYGNVTWDVNDRTTLSAELRFQEDEVTNASNVTNLSFTNTTSSVQPRLAINHTINNNWSAYGQYSSGTNPAGVSIDFLREIIGDSLEAARTSGFITYNENTFLQFEEEELTNFEVGIKGSALDNRLQLAAALYVMEWDKMIQPIGFNWDDASWNDGTFDPQGRVFTMADTMAMGFLNVGDGDLSGVEVEASWRPNENWNFRGALALASAEFAQSCDPRPVNEFGFTPTRTTQQGAPYDCVEVAGNDITEQPDTTLSLSGTYTAPLGVAGWEWSARLNVRYTDETARTDDVVNLAYLPAYSILNGSLSFRNDNWNVTLYGNNLSDDDTPRQVEYGNDNNIVPARNGFLIRPRLPREIGARLSFEF